MTPAARVGGLLGLALLAACVVVAPPSGSGPVPEVLSAREIRADEVRAQVTYAEEIKAGAVRGTVVRSPKVKGGHSLPGTS